MFSGFRGGGEDRNNRCGGFQSVAGKLAYLAACGGCGEKKAGKRDTYAVSYHMMSYFTLQLKHEIHGLKYMHINMFVPQQYYYKQLAPWLASSSVWLLPVSLLYPDYSVLLLLLLL